MIEKANAVLHQFTNYRHSSDLPILSNLSGQCGRSTVFGETAESINIFALSLSSRTVTVLMPIHGRKYIENVVVA